MKVSKSRRIVFSLTCISAASSLSVTPSRRADRVFSKSHCRSKVACSAIAISPQPALLGNAVHLSIPPPHFCVSYVYSFAAFAVHRLCGKQWAVGGGQWAVG